MRPAIVRTAVSQVIEEAKRTGQPFHIQLAGGEPTLVPEVIDQVVTMVKEAGFSGRNVAIQTNATRIDQGMAARIKAWGIGVGVSVDGPPDIQEQARGNAKATFAGLINLAAFDVPVRITSVVSSINQDRLDELVLTLSCFANVRGVGLDVLVPLGAAKTRPDLSPDPNLLAKGIRKMYSALELVNHRRDLPLVWRELEAVRTALARPANTVRDHRRAPLPLVGAMGKSRPYCFATTGQSMAISPSGAVYPCSQRVGDPTQAAGHIGQIDHNVLARLGAIEPMHGPCATCALNGRCPGDCPSRLEANQQHGYPPLMCVIYATIAQLECAP